MNKGFGSIAMLGLILILSILLFKAERIIINTLKLTSKYKDLLLYKTDLKIDYATKINDTCQGSEIKICALRPVNQALYDYNQAFTKLMPCNYLQASNPYKIDNEQNYSSGSFISSQTCLEFPRQFPIAENLKLSGDISTTAKEIISAGFIYIDGTISLSQDTTIIAGGDIIIKRLFSSIPVNLYINSASGSIQINEKSDTITINKLPESYTLNSFIYSVLYDNRESE